jgi:hypothetical protein
MKKFIIPVVITIISCSVTKSFAQKSVDIAFKSGVSIPNLTSGSNANPINSGYSSRVGADEAVQAEFHLSKHFSIEPGLEYSQQGAKRNGVQAFAVPANMMDQFPSAQEPPYLYADYKSTVKINYLMLPVLAKYRFAINKHFGAYAAAGPFASVVLSAKNITSGTSNIYLDEQFTQPVTSDPQSFDDKENIRKDLHHYNAGVSANAGINYNVGRGSLFIEGGGNYGFVDIQKDGSNGKNKTGAGMIDLGYQFRICSK